MPLHQMPTGHPRQADTAKSACVRVSRLGARCGSVHRRAGPRPSQPCLGRGCRTGLGGATAGYGARRGGPVDLTDSATGQRAGSGGVGGSHRRPSRPGSRGCRRSHWHQTQQLRRETVPGSAARGSYAALTDGSARGVSPLDAGGRPSAAGPVGVAAGLRPEVCRSPSC